MTAELHDANRRFRDDDEASIAMFMRRDSHSIGTSAFKQGRKPEWPHHGL